MRALLLLLVSVLLLATIQVSYTAASAKWLSPGRDNGGSSQSHKTSTREHRDHAGHNRHDHPYENTYHGHSSRYSDGLGDNFPYQDHSSNLRDKESDKLNLPSYKPYVPPYIESIHKQGRFDADEILRNGVDKSSPDKPNVRVERVEHPRKSMDVRKNRNKYKKEEHGHVRKPEGSFHQDPSKSSHHGRKMQPKQQQKGDKKQSKKSRKQCVGDKECNGGCCVPAKNGKKYCKKASIKESGEKCASSCVCKSELRCFIGEYKRNGGTKVHKDKKRILGRCINPDVADYNNGYFVDEIQMIE